MDGSVTDAQANKWLQEIADKSWVSLHYETPALGGTEAAELSGGSYARYKMIWSQPTNRAIWSMTDARFTGLVQTKITYFGVWDAATKGMLRAYSELPTPAAVLNGKGFILPVGTVAVSFG